MNSSEDKSNLGPPSYDNVYPVVPQIAPQTWQGQAMPTQQPQTILIVNSPIEYPNDPVKLNPCPHCKVNSVSKVEYKTSSCTHGTALILCCVCWPLVWLPYCTKWFKLAVHTCENCNAYLGTHSPVRS